MRLDKYMMFCLTHSTSNVVRFYMNFHLAPSNYHCAALSSTNQQTVPINSVRQSLDFKHWTKTNTSLNVLCGWHKISTHFCTVQYTGKHTNDANIKVYMTRRPWVYELYKWTSSSLHYNNQLPCNIYECIVSNYRTKEDSGYDTA